MDKKTWNKILNENTLVSEDKNHDAKAAKEVLNKVINAAVKAEMKQMDFIKKRVNVPYDHKMIKLLMLRELQEWVRARIMDAQKG